MKNSPYQRFLGDLKFRTLLEWIKFISFKVANNSKRDKLCGKPLHSILSTRFLCRTAWKVL